MTSFGLRVLSSIKRMYIIPHGTKCRVVSSTDISPTIRSFDLEVIDKSKIKSLDFKPGQWVDFYVESLQKMTGYSITSIPETLQNSNLISVAVKQSNDVISSYLHSNKVINSSFYLRVGGNFHSSNFDKAKHFILICGGIGITPFSSIFQYFCRYPGQSRMTLFYSASSPNEFALLNELKNAQKLAPNKSEIILNVTRNSNEQKEQEWNGNIGRIKIEMIKECKDKYCKEYDDEHYEYLICGPSQMIDEFNEMLQKQMNVKQKQIHFEKWW